MRGRVRFAARRLSAIASLALGFRKSMFGQVAVLTAVFIGWGVYTFVVQPIVESYPAQPSPLESTSSDLLDAARAVLADDGGTPDRRATARLDALVRAIRSRNPDFRYYGRSGDRQFGDRPGVFYRKFHLDEVERLHRAIGKPNLCTQFVTGASETAAGGYAEFNMCDSISYLEYSGLLRPLAIKRNYLTPVYERWLGPFSRAFLIPAGGVFLIFVIIMGANMVMIRRVAALTKTFDPRHLDRQLPEKGLAIEVLPLVRAVNRLIAQVAEYQRRNAFFLSAAAHEMRTPLTVLRTRLEMLEDGGLKDKLIGDVRRLIDLVNQLLALMTIGNRGAIANYVDLVTCGRDAAVEFHPIGAARGVDIGFESEVPGHEIIGDTALIHSAIANMVRNALSFTPAGGRIDIRMGSDGRLSVRDTGPGIAHANPEALFEPFVRSPPKRDGYGLGLAIVKAIAGLHGGEVEAANAAGGGAIFSIIFPLQD